jgi:hypothetical protein
MTSPSQTITKHSDKTIVKLQVEDSVSKLWATKAKRLGMSRNDYLLNLLRSNETGFLPVRKQ